METMPGKLNATVKAGKTDFSDIEALFECECFADAFGTVILARNPNFGTESE